MGPTGGSRPVGLLLVMMDGKVDMTTTLSLSEVLLDSAKEVFESMVFMPLEVVEAEMPDSDDVTLLGVITFTGAMEGCLSVCCGMSCAKTVAANMLCMESPDDLSDEDVIDAMGEISNMVMGSVKTRLQDHVADMTISIPSVVQGRELRSRLSEGMTKVVANVTLAAAHHATFSLLYREVGGASEAEG